MKGRILAKWHGNELVDMQNRPFVVGDAFVKVYSTCNIQICHVTDIKNGKIYADHSKSPIQHSCRLLIDTEQLLITHEKVQAKNDSH
jgi:hypothetical protein